MNMHVDLNVLQQYSTVHCKFEFAMETESSLQPENACRYKVGSMHPCQLRRPQNGL